MSLNLQFRSGEDLASVAIGSESGIIKQLREHAPTEVDLIFGVAKLGEAERVNAQQIFDAAKKLLELVKSGTVEFPTTYFLIKPAGGTIHAGMDTKIDGVMHSFNVGIDVCTMQSVYRDESGAILRGDVIDLRAIEVIQTDRGSYRIGRKLTSSWLKHALSNIQTFCKRHSSEIVMKCIS